MSTHPTQGELRAYLDRSRVDDARSRFEDHLATCSACRARLADVDTRAGLVRGILAALDPAPAEATPAVDIAFARFQARHAAGGAPINNAYRKDRYPMTAWLTSPGARRLAVGAAAVALVAGALAFQPVRALAGQFLRLFRVEKVIVLPVDPAQFQALDSNKALGQAIGRLFSDSVTVLHEPAEPRAVADAADASRAAGFTVRLPADLAHRARLSVRDATAFEFNVDRERAQAIFDTILEGAMASGALEGTDAAALDVALPPALDGATVSVTIPKGVAAAFGDCGELDQAADVEQKGDPDRSEHSEGRGVPTDCVMLAQIPSPQVVAPPELDVAGLAEIGLRFIGFSPLEAKAMSRTVDWTSTLVVPIPRGSVSSKPVAVDGVEGVLLRQLSGDDGQRLSYVILWVKGGIVYVVTGGGMPDQGLALANGLP